MCRLLFAKYISIYSFRLSNDKAVGLNCSRRRRVYRPLPITSSQPFSTIKQVEKSQVEEWLHITPRFQHGQQSCAGLRITHRGQKEPAESPFSLKLAHSFNQALGLTLLSCGRFF